MRVRFARERREPLIDAQVRVRQRQVLDAKQPQDGRVKVGDIDRIFGDRPANFIGFAVGDAALGATTCHEHAE